MNRIRAIRVRSYFCWSGDCLLKRSGKHLRLIPDNAARVGTGLRANFELPAHVFKGMIPQATTQHTRRGLFLLGALVLICLGTAARGQSPSPAASSAAESPASTPAATPTPVSLAEVITHAESATATLRG